MKGNGPRRIRAAALGCLILAFSASASAQEPAPSPDASPPIAIEPAGPSDSETSRDAALRISTPRLTDLTRPAPGDERQEWRFETGARLLCEFEVLGATPDEDGTLHVSTTFAIRRPDGSVATQSEPVFIPPSSDGRVVRRALIDTGGLPGGDYRLRLTVCDEVAGAIVEADGPIQLVPRTGSAPSAAAKKLATALIAGRGPDTYLALANEFRKGHREAAVRALAEWTEEECDAAINQLTVAQPASCDPVCRRSAALLETQLAFSFLAIWHETEGAAHLEKARKLIEPSPPDHFLRDWLLVVGQTYRGMEERSLAVKWFEECAARFPNEAACELALGVVREEEVFQFTPRSGLQIRIGGSDVDWNDLMRTQSNYERALRLVPDWEEAHLRFGRFLLRRGELDGAKREATWVLANAKRSPERSRARLLLGAAEEQKKRFEAAIAHYQEAVKEEPASQIARVALSHALYRSERHAAAAEEARGLLALPGSSMTTDGWLSWIDATLTRDELLRSLLAEVKP